ncbi:MAG: DUF2273 domain-containing protein [Paenibacillaceae bacterium]
MWQTVWNVVRGEHRGKLLGVLFGIFCGFLYLFTGFWDMLIFTFIVYVGYYVGRRIDEHQAPFDASSIWQWLTRSWKGFK